MGKRYYCDYCERSFADGAENRKKHLVSVNHQKLRKAHYDMFKDAATLLQEEKLKNPCRKFQYTGSCEFGTGCKFSHFTPLEMQKLEEQAFMEKMGISAKRPKLEPNIDSWIQSKMSKIKEHTPSSSGLPHPVLPSVLASIPNLPPSLIPSTQSELYDAHQRNTSMWG